MEMLSVEFNIITDLRTHTSLSQLVHKVTIMSNKSCTKSPQLMPIQRPYLAAICNKLKSISQKLKEFKLDHY